MTDIDQIKQKIDIVNLISEYVALKKTGANFKGLCPFHTEKTPSFIVSPERQIWHCFGACQEGGDIFKFIMKAENLDFPETLNLLAKRAGVTLVSRYQKSRDAAIREKIFAINHLASEFYHYILTSYPLGQKARDYVENRKISPTSLKLFSLGYAPNSWDSLTSFFTKKGYSTSDLATAGLVSQSSLGHYFDRFRGRLIFTLRDHQKNVVGFAGRLLDEKVHSESDRGAKYVNTTQTPVYVKGNILYGLDVTHEEIKKEGFAVVVEGEIDAIQSYQAGVRNVVAIKGSALTEGQIHLLKRYTENILLSLDADYAGDTAAHRGIETADAAGLNIKVVNIKGVYPEGQLAPKDPDDLIKKNPTLWHQAVRQAVNFYDYIIDSATSRFDPHLPEQAKQIVAETAKFLNPIDNLVVKNHYLKKLAARLDVPFDILETQIEKESKKSLIPLSLRPVESKKQTTVKSRQEVLEEYLLALLLQSKKPQDYLLLISPRLSSSDFVSPPLEKIYQLLTSLVDNPKSDVTLPQETDEKFTIAQFLKIVPAELAPQIDRLFLFETNIDTENDTPVLAEIQNTAWELKEISLRAKLKVVSLQIKKSPDSVSLEQDFFETSAKLSRLLEEKALLDESSPNH